MTPPTEPTEPIDRLASVSGELLAWLKSTAESSEAFVLEQAPLYVQEYVALVFWSGMAGLFITIVVLAIVWAITAGVAWKIHTTVRDTVNDGLQLLPICLVGVFSLFGLVPLSHNAHSVIKATVAPRVVIVEHVAKVLKP